MVGGHRLNDGRSFRGGSFHGYDDALRNQAATARAPADSEQGGTQGAVTPRTAGEPKPAERHDSDAPGAGVGPQPSEQLHPGERESVPQQRGRAATGGGPR